jgi:hypothetical protein
MERARRILELFEIGIARFNAGYPSHPPQPGDQELLTRISAFMDRVTQQPDAAEHPRLQ